MFGGPWGHTAGTWSDGKLTTRIGKNSVGVRTVLEALVKYGAPERILVDGKPHLGTDRIVKVCNTVNPKSNSEWKRSQISK